MTGISSSHTEAAGFTLIELLVVLTIIGLLGTVAAIQWQRSPAVSPQAGRIMKIRSALRTARQEALAGGKPITVQPGRLSAGSAWQKGTDLVFYGGGGAAGGGLRGDGGPRLAVDWISGFVHAVP